MAGMSDAADMAKMGNMANMNQRTQVQQSLFVSPLPPPLLLSLPMSHPSIRYFYTCLMCSETIDFWRFHNPQESWDFYHLPSAAGRMDETLMFSHQLWDFPLFDFFILRKLYANICFNGIFWNNSLVPISEQSIQGNCEKYQLKHTNRKCLLLCILWDHHYILLKIITNHGYAKWSSI